MKIIDKVEIVVKKERKDSYSIEFCCNEMESLWNQTSSFYPSYEYRNILYKEDTGIYFINLTGYDNYERLINTKKLKFKFCPFCGKENTEEIQRID